VSDPKIFTKLGLIDLAILLAGCTSTGLTNVYLLSLSYTAKHPVSLKSSSLQVNPGISQVFTGIVNATSSLEIRAGFMGMCIRDSIESWSCSTDANTLAKSIILSKGAVGDPLNLVWIANTFKRQMVFNGML